MKTLFLLRHAKSSWDDPDLPDHRRPLNKRGRKTAPLMGQFLAAEKLMPDVIISSTAVRAGQTARLIARHGEFPGSIELTDALYPTTPRRCVSVLQTVPGDAAAVMLVGHNAGMEEFVEHLSGRFERLPTCALVQLEVPIDDWAEFTLETRATLVSVWRPKEMFDL